MPVQTVQYGWYSVIILTLEWISSFCIFLFFSETLCQIKVSEKLGGGGERNPGMKKRECDFTPFSQNFLTPLHPQGDKKCHPDGERQKKVIFLQNPMFAFRVRITFAKTNKDIWAILIFIFSATHASLEFILLSFLILF